MSADYYRPPPFAIAIGAVPYRVTLAFYGTRKATYIQQKCALINGKGLGVLLGAGALQHKLLDVCFTKR